MILIFQCDFKINILLLYRDEKDSDDLKYGLIGTIPLVVIVVCVSVAVACRYGKFDRCMWKSLQKHQELQELQEQTQGRCLMRLMYNAGIMGFRLKLKLCIMTKVVICNAYFNR